MYLAAISPDRTNNEFYDGLKHEGRVTILETIRESKSEIKRHFNNEIKTQTIEWSIKKAETAALLTEENLPLAAWCRSSALKIERRGEWNESNGDCED